MAAIGALLMAARLNSGSPNYGVGLGDRLITPQPDAE
jgi:ABC-type xylose transport system permease subunit